MAKKKRRINNLYVFYFLFYSGSLWGLCSYFGLAFLYFHTNNPLLFWVPAFTIFLPATISLTTQVSEGISITILLAAFYGIMLAVIGELLYRATQKTVTKPYARKRG